MTRHPSDEKLVAWLETGRPRRTGRHLEDCETCMERVEGLTDLDGGLLSGLASASSPPPDLHTRTKGRVHDRLAAEEALASLLELFAVPWTTATALFDTQPIGSGGTKVPGPRPGDRTDTAESEPTNPVPPVRDHTEERSDG